MASSSCLTGAVVGISVGAVGKIDIVSATPRLGSLSPVNISTPPAVTGLVTCGGIGEGAYTGVGGVYTDGAGTYIGGARAGARAGAGAGAGVLLGGPPTGPPPGSNGPESPGVCLGGNVGDVSIPDFVGGAGLDCTGADVMLTPG